MIDKTAAEIKAINQSFIEKIAQGGMADLTKAGGDYIATEVQETSFVDKTLIPKDVTPEECQTSEDSDTLYKLVPKKPEYKAILLNADGEPFDIWMKGSRVKVPFFKIATDIITKTEEEIIAMERPVVDAIEEDLTKYIADAKDKKFVAMIDYAIAHQTVAKTVTGLAAGTISRSEFGDLLNKIETTRLIVNKILLTRSVANIISTDWPATDAGDAFAGEATKEGWNADTLIGRPIIKHIKNNITNTAAGKFRIFAFATEYEGRLYCGVSYILQAGTSPLKMYNRFSEYSWMAQQMCAFDIINVESVSQYIEKT